MQPLLGLSFAFLMATVPLLGQQASAPVPFLGIWKLNLAKSDYGAFPLPKFVTLVIEDRGGGYFKETNTGQPAEGPAGTVEQILKCDGQDHQYQSTIQVPNRPKVSTTRYVSCVARDA